MNISCKKSFFQLIAVIGLSIYGEGLKAASFDCEKAYSAMEKLICSNDYVSDLDEELGQAYKEALIKYADKKDMLARQQRNWLKWIRSQCTDPSCLNTLYGARLGEIIDGENVSALDGSNNPNFVLTRGRGTPVCGEYLNILNSTPREELRACKLPDLSNSKIEPVEFRQIKGNKLEKLDKFIYENKYHKEWEKIWSERKLEYAMGYRGLSEASWDLDQDGIPDQVIKETYPGRICDFLGKGELAKVQSEANKNWRKTSIDEKFKKTKDVGFESLYMTIKNEKLFFLDGEAFVYFDNQYFSVDHVGLNSMNAESLWADKQWVNIWKINSSPNEKRNTYGKTPAVCSFWFNK